MPLALTLATVLTVVSRIRDILGNPLVNKAIDNFVAKTPTVLDEKVWAVIEAMMGLDDKDAASSIARAKLAKIQLDYSNADEAGKEFLHSEAPSGPVYPFSRPVLLADVPNIHAPMPPESATTG